MSVSKFVKSGGMEGNKGTGSLLQGIMVTLAGNVLPEGIRYWEGSYVWGNVSLMCMLGIWAGHAWEMLAVAVVACHTR